MKEIKRTEKRRAQFFTRRDWFFIAVAGIYTTVLVIISYIINLRVTNDEQTARAVAFAGLGLTHIALILGLSHLKNLPSKVIIVFSIVILLFVIQLPWIASFFEMQPLALTAWMPLLLCSVATLALARWS